MKVQLGTLASANKVKTGNYTCSCKKEVSWSSCTCTWRSKLILLFSSPCITRQDMLGKRIFWTTDFDKGSSWNKCVLKVRFIFSLVIKVYMKTLTFTLYCHARGELCRLQPIEKEYDFEIEPWLGIKILLANFLTHDFIFSTLNINFAPLYLLEEKKKFAQCTLINHLENRQFYQER